jgi:Protein of unknown function (DUF2752)
MKNTKTTKWLILAFFILTPILFLLLPATYFDEGEALCPSKRFFNVECPGCGMTRAVMHMIHFDFESAIYFNIMSVILTPILVFMWIKWTWGAAQEVGLMK